MTASSMKERLAVAGAARELKPLGEASVQARRRRAEDVRLQQLAPSEWFSAAASECAEMYVAGYFYGAIAVAQAYVDALSSFLCERHQMRPAKTAALRCKSLRREDVLSDEALAASLAVLSSHNDFRGLDRDVDQHRQCLEQRARNCVECIRALEAALFSYTSRGESVIPRRPLYWCCNEQGELYAHARGTPWFG